MVEEELKLFFFITKYFETTQHYLSQCITIGCGCDTGAACFVQHLTKFNDVTGGDGLVDLVESQSCHGSTYLQAEEALKL